MNVFHMLQEGCEGKLNAVRISVLLEPGGGSTDKVFPPTYAGSEGENQRGEQTPTYAFEERLVNGEKVQTVLLDSVQSQANRLEQLLKEACDLGECRLPMVKTDIPNHGVITAFDAPHRIYDAIFRDCQLNGQRFFESDVGKLLCAASQSNATALYRYAPTVLLFGAWDSHSARGAQGAKIPRALVSEIIGIVGALGCKTSSRIDPLGIRKEIPIFSDDAGYWTLDEAEAKEKKLKKKKASELGHGNIVPSIDYKTGGISIKEARQFATLSLRQLCNLHFPDENGRHAEKRDVAGRVVIAAIGLYALALQVEKGYQLRSRCLLVPTDQPCWEFVGAVASDVQKFQMDVGAARELLERAVGEAEAEGLVWGEDLVLTPLPQLVELVARSDQKAALAMGQPELSEERE